MALPRFLLGDNSNYPEDIFIIHTEFPRFVINLKDDSMDFLEDFKGTDKETLTEEVENLIKEATDFYDEEIKNYE